MVTHVKPGAADPLSARHEQLLDAADRVVQRDGPAASMSSIASEAGITKPILYRKFGDKGGLYRALAERHTATLLASLSRALNVPGTRLDRTRATIDTYLELVEGHPEIYRFLLHGEAAEHPHVRGEVAFFLRRFGDVLARGISHETGLAPDDPTAVSWAHGIVGMVQGAGDWWLGTRGFPGALTRAELVTRLTDLLGGAFADPARYTVPPTHSSRPDPLESSS